MVTTGTKTYFRTGANTQLSAINQSVHKQGEQSALVQVVVGTSHLKSIIDWELRCLQSGYCLGSSLYLFVAIL